jgi:hypothetical protein
LPGRAGGTDDVRKPPWAVHEDCEQHSPCPRRAVSHMDLRVFRIFKPEDSSGLGRQLSGRRVTSERDGYHARCGGMSVPGHSTFRAASMRCAT